MKVIDKKFQGRRFYRHDFTKDKDLTKADFRNASLIECDFTGIDLSYATFDGANLYGAIFKDACLNYVSFRDATMVRCDMNARSMVDVTVTLNCNSFSDIVINDDLFLFWMFIGIQMTGYTPELKSKAIALVGAEKYAAISRMFKSHV